MRQRRGARTATVASHVQDGKEVAQQAQIVGNFMQLPWVHRPAVRTHGQTEYSPTTWRYTIQNLFREFNESRAKKDRVRPHDLRARAITLVAAATQSVDATAEALGVDPQTARQYLDSAKAFNGSDIMKKLTGVLLPQNAPQNSEPDSK